MKQTDIKCIDANVILFGIDTLRYDHLGFAGYHRNTSPNIDALAKESIVFKNCFSQAPITAPSFASIFTSRYPTYHAVMDVIRSRRVGRSLAPSIPTLATILKKSDYTTVAFTEGVNLIKKIGLDRGFDTYETKPFSLIDARRHPAVQWMKRNLNKKFFLFFHTYEAHRPYLPPPPYNEFYHKNYKGAFPTSFKGLKALKKKFGPDAYYLLMEKNKHNAAEVEFLKAQYDGCINYVDNFIGQFLEELKKLKLDRRTIIIFTSDHGEEFMDHGRVFHKNYHDELLHIPLIIKPPSWTKCVEVKQIVRSIDIASTILDMLGMRPDPSFQGRSLIPALNRNLGLVAPMEYGHFGIALRTSQFKYIFRFGNKSKRIELYNIVQDPLEKENLAAVSPQLIERLHRTFEEELTRKNFPRPPHLIFLLDYGVNVEKMKTAFFKRKKHL